MIGIYKLRGSGDICQTCYIKFIVLIVYLRCFGFHIENICLLCLMTVEPLEAPHILCILNPLQFRPQVIKQYVLKRKNRWEA